MFSMNKLIYYTRLILVIIIIFVSGCERGEKRKPEKRVSDAQLKTDPVIVKLKEKFGEHQVARKEREVKQGAGLWIEVDGNAKEFTQFCEEQFIVDREILTQTFRRNEKNLE